MSENTGKKRKRIFLDQILVHKATQALVEHLKSKPSNVLQLRSTTHLHLGITLKQLPTNKVPPIHIILPHSVSDPKNRTVCFITDYTKDELRQLFVHKSLTVVNKILTTNTLAHKYNRFELRRHLVNRFDVFLVDHRAFPRMPTLLGKIFIEKSKMPVRVILKEKRKITLNIYRALRTATFRISPGSTSSLSVGNLDYMTPEQLAENITCALNTLMLKLPKGWHNLRTAFIKTDRSTALPIFSCLQEPPLQVDSAPIAIESLPKSDLISKKNKREKMQTSLLGASEALLDRTGTYSKITNKKTLAENLRLLGKTKTKKPKLFQQQSAAIKKKQFKSYRKKIGAKKIIKTF